ncbi:MAG: SDR family NAD(P)-dependent oxidoreductase [Syntrophales bacterium]|nr:SDR family NAD(P)-dependent oxidoreductase [Syntrophales bacterium]
MELKISGKVAVVTGGGRGHGEAMSMALAKEGVTVVVADLNGQSAQKVQGEIAARGGKGTAFQVDVTQADQVERMMEEAERQFGQIDILVNNACAPIRRVPFMELELSEWINVLQVNLTGTFICSRAAAKIMMKKRKGRIINISSFAANLPASGFAAYSASKAGIEALSKTVAGELGKHGISTIFVRPGVMETEFTKPQHQGAVGEKMLSSIPLGRFGTTDELANLIVFLVSDAASYINGGPIPIDGGKYVIQF